MKFLKGLFPSGKKTVGTIIMVGLGIMVYNIINRKTGLENTIARNIPSTKNSNMKAVNG